MKEATRNGNLALILALALFSLVMYWWSVAMVKPGFLAGLGHVLAGLAGQYILLIIYARRILVRSRGGRSADRAWRIAAYGVMVWLAAGPVAIMLDSSYIRITWFFPSIFVLAALAGALSLAPLPMNNEAKSLRLATGAALLALGAIPLVLKF